MTEPDGIDQLFQQAVARHQQGDLVSAIGTYQLVISLRPKAPAVHVNLGIALQALGRLEEAEAAFRRAIALEPLLAEAHNSLGCVLIAQGRAEEAVSTLICAAALMPDQAQPQNNLGNALRLLGKTSEAEDCYRRAVALEDDSPQPSSNLAALLLEQGRIDEAMAFSRHTLSRYPSHQDSWNNLGNALVVAGQLAEAEQAFLQAPNLAEAGTNLAALLYDQERFADATVQAKAVIARHPTYALAFNTLGNCLLALGKLPESEAAFRQGLALSPGDAQMRMNFSSVLLKQGKFTEGWQAYEARRHRPQARSFDVPAWTGQELDGPLLIHAEQGLGDCLQFCRYVSLLTQPVILQVQPELTRLLQSLPVPVIGRDQPLPPHAAHLPLMSLPRLFPGIPATTPYLAADPAQIELWRRRLAALPGRKVGLVWSGDPRPYSKIAHLLDRRRSFPAETYHPLTGIPGLSLISLQKGEAGPGLPIIDWTAELHDMADTAALVSALDLVITVDTSVAHLAGALAKPVWILSRFDGCWRWLDNRDDSPWYPTARLFRQQSQGDWAGVIERVADALRAGTE